MTRSLPPGTPHPSRLRVAMALYGDLTHDSRVIREAESLARAGHAVTVACLTASPTTIERLQPLVRVVVRQPPGDAALPGAPNPFRSGRRRALALVDRALWLWQYRSSLRWWGREVSDAVGPVDVWHAHDLTGLEAAVSNAPRGAQVVYDSHELYLDTGTPARLPAPARRLLRWREAVLVRRCAAVITVNPGLARVLGDRYRPARMEVVRNCAERWDPPDPPPDLLRAMLGISRAFPIVLFHGGLEPNRGIHLIVAALTVAGLEEMHVVLLGRGQLQPDLERRTHDPELGGRLHVLPPVTPAELPDWVASADVGAVLQQPADRNFVLSTPNKLFESIAAGTPVLASDLPEIRRIVSDDPDGPLGVLCDPQDAAAVADALRSMLALPRRDLLEMRARCLRAAHARLNWESEAGRLVALYEALAASRRDPGTRLVGT